MTARDGRPPQAPISPNTTTGQRNTIHSGQSDRPHETDPSTVDFRGWPLVARMFELLRIPTPTAWHVYTLGYTVGQIHAAARVAELDALWRPVGRVAYEQRVAARSARTAGGPDWPGLDHGGVLPSADWGDAA